MVTFEALSKTYRSGRGEVRALREVSGEVGEGRAMAVVGKSGSGKTTLLNCVLGLERPESGRIFCLGAALHALSDRDLALFQRRHTGYVFQFGNLLSYLTVRQNIAFPLFLNGVGRAKRERRATELLERIGLPGFGDALPRELSGGEVQRVSFARAVAHRPGMLLADEPTASLDSGTAEALVRLMIEVVRESDCALLVSTHDPVVIRLADEVMRLRDGRRVAETDVDVL